jgi:hypothetical protein
MSSKLLSVLSISKVSSDGQNKVWDVAPHARQDRVIIKCMILQPVDRKCTWNRSITDDPLIREELTNRLFQPLIPLCDVLHSHWYLY